MTWRMSRSKGSTSSSCAIRCPRAQPPTPHTSPCHYGTAACRGTRTNACLPPHCAPSSAAVTRSRVTRSRPSPPPARRMAWRARAGITPGRMAPCEAACWPCGCCTLACRGGAPGARGAWGGGEQGEEHLEPGEHEEELLVVGRVEPAADGDGVLGLQQVRRRAVVHYDALAWLPSHPLRPRRIVSKHTATSSSHRSTNQQHPVAAGATSRAHERTSAPALKQQAAGSQVRVALQACRRRACGEQGGS